MREITTDEVSRLLPCLEALAQHHNEVSEHFKGAYPAHAYADVLAEFAQLLRAGSSKIAVVEQGADIVGFCKIDLRPAAKLSHLVVLKGQRGKGYGAKLMDWVMAQFASAGCRQIELKVVAGNPAIGLYERYGFQTSAYIMWRRD